MKGKQFYCIYFLISHDEQTQKAFEQFQGEERKVYNFHDNAKNNTPYMSAL
jgi:hypothetical protein